MMPKKEYKFNNLYSSMISEPEFESFLYTLFNLIDA